MNGPDLLAEAAKIVARHRDGRAVALAKQIEGYLRVDVGSDLQLLQHALVGGNQAQPVASPLDLGSEIVAEQVPGSPSRSDHAIKYTYEDIARTVGVSVEAVRHLFQPASAVSATQPGKGAA